MKTNRLVFRESGFTLIELSIYSLLAMVLSAVSFSFLISGAGLATKNTNLNRSHDDLRLAFDRLAFHLSASNNVPTLIDTNGTAVTGPVVAITAPQVGTKTGPAAGLKFDRVIGQPYLVQDTAPTSTATLAGSLSASATTAPVWISTEGLTHVPTLVPASGSDVSAEGYIFLLPLANGTNLRLRISSIANAGSATGRKKLTLTFATSVGQAISWTANQPQLATIVRAEAFLVMPVTLSDGTKKNELRYYRKFEPMPNLNDKTQYVVLCDQIGSQTTEEGQPFSIVDYDGDRYVQSTLRVRERDKNKWLTSDPNAGFYTYFQLHVNLPSRLRPRTSL